VEADLSWPLSTDSIAVLQKLNGEGLRQTLADAEDRRRAMANELAASRAEQRRLFLERAAFEHERTVLERERTDLKKDLRETSSELEAARQQITELRQILDGINQSLTFRVAQPVFGLMNRIKKRGRK
jgi:septal ring factor EnvC (AmiA/AmiB activator)